MLFSLPYIINCELIRIKSVGTNVSNIANLSFDDNNVLKVQLKILIFFQGCRTID